MVRQQRHLGVYGFCVRDARLLLIRKARGPYTGLLDLPGGGIAFGEQPEETLRREFLEETGLEVTPASLWTVRSHTLRHTTVEGSLEDLHHIGVLYRVAIPEGETGPLKSEPDGEDSHGAVWVAFHDLHDGELTPFARWAFREDRTL